MDEVGLLQHREVRRHRRLGDIELVAELPCAHRPVAQELQHAAAGRVGKGLEDIAHDSMIS
jgi:hypothetical protein